VLLNTPVTYPTGAAPPLLLLMERVPNSKNTVNLGRHAPTPSELAELSKSFWRDGFVVVRGAVPPEMVDILREETPAWSMAMLRPLEVIFGKLFGTWNTMVCCLQSCCCCVPLPPTSAHCSLPTTPNGLPLEPSLLAGFRSIFLLLVAS
jgi:hypothetical protein